MSIDWEWDCQSLHLYNGQKVKISSNYHKQEILTWLAEKGCSKFIYKKQKGFQLVSMLLFTLMYRNKISLLNLIEGQHLVGILGSLLTWMLINYLLTNWSRNTSNSLFLMMKKKWMKMSMESQSTNIFIFRANFTPLV